LESQSGDSIHIHEQEHQWVIGYAFGYEDLGNPRSDMVKDFIISGNWKIQLHSEDLSVRSGLVWRNAVTAGDLGNASTAAIQARVGSHERHLWNTCQVSLARRFWDAT
jgi:hypothetical protein